MGKILAICISEKKGTQKKPVESARLVEEWGIEEMPMWVNGTVR